MSRFAVIPMLLAPLAMTPALSAATLVEFDFEGGTDGHLPSPSTVDAGAVTATPFTAGAGMNVGTGSAASPLYRTMSSNPSLVQRATKMSSAESEADAVGSEVFWEFSLTPIGDAISLDALEFTFGAYNENPQMTFFVRTDADGDNFTTNLLGAVNGGTPTGLFGPTTETQTLTPVSIDLASQSIDFSNLAGATAFRIYLFRGQDVPGLNNGFTAGLGDLTLTGDVVPEPASVALLALGAVMVGCRPGHGRHAGARA